MQEEMFESMINSFHLSDEDFADREGCLGVTFWIPADRKVKYDKIQGKSRRRFHKFLKALIIKSIDSVDVEE